MGAPVPPPFQIHLGIDKAIEKDKEYWRKEFRRQAILGWTLAGGTLIGVATLIIITIARGG